MFSSSHGGFNLTSYLGRNNRSLMTAAPSACYSLHSAKTIPINNIRLFVIKANYLLLLFTDSDRLLLIKKKKIPRTLSKPYLRVVALLRRNIWHWLRCVCHFRIEARKETTPTVTRCALDSKTGQMICYKSTHDNIRTCFFFR